MPRPLRRRSKTSTGRPQQSPGTTAPPDLTMYAGGAACPPWLMPGESRELLASDQTPETGTSTKTDEDDPEGDRSFTLDQASLAEVKAMRVQQLFRNCPIMSDSGFTPNKEMSLNRVDFHQAFNSGRMVDEKGEPMTLTEALNHV